MEQISRDIRRPYEGLSVIAGKDTLGDGSAKFIKRSKASVGAGAWVLVTVNDAWGQAEQAAQLHAVLPKKE